MMTAALKSVPLQLLAIFELCLEMKQIELLFITQGLVMFIYVFLDRIHGDLRLKYIKKRS